MIDDFQAYISFSQLAENAANLVPEKGGQSAPSVQGGEIDWLEDAGYILNSETTWQKLAAFSWIETRHAERPLTFLQNPQDFKQTVCPGS